MSKTVHDAFAIPDIDEVVKDNVIYYKGFPVYAESGAHKAILAQAELYLQPGARVIDLGAGTGAFSLRLLERGYEVTAAGLEPDTFASKKVPFLPLNFNDNLPKEHHGKFDAVFAIDVVEHLENIFDFFRKLNLLLKPQGFAFVSSPNIFSVKSRLMFIHSGNLFMFSPDHALNPGHIQVILPWMIKIAGEWTGLTQIKIIGIGKFMNFRFPWWQNLATLLTLQVKKLLYREKFLGEFSTPSILAILKKEVLI